jgi:uncharacterized membrane-anchored protein YjiN (DUF445 family)
MGEIKSAIELAMERSKRFVISKEDREAIREKEILQKAASLFYRYQDGHIPFHEIEREIEKLEEEIRGPVKEALLSQWVEALSLSGDPGRILDGIESLRGRDFNKVREKVRGLLQEYVGEVEAEREKKRRILEEALRKEGIYGEAVDPNLEGNEEWKALVNTLHHSYQKRLEEIKNVIRTS